MWINGSIWSMVQAEVITLRDARVRLAEYVAIADAKVQLLREQKAKDDITIDWMRHRVNALEKEKAALLVSKGVNISVPEIVPTRPGTISAPPAGFDHLPSFEDVGDEQAAQFGLSHDDAGRLVLGMPESARG